MSRALKCIESFEDIIFTEGKVYPLVEHESSEYIATVVCDRGHLRSIGRDLLQFPVYCPRPPAGAKYARFKAVEI